MKFNVFTTPRTVPKLSTVKELDDVLTAQGPIYIFVAVTTPPTNNPPPTPTPPLIVNAPVVVEIVGVLEYIVLVPVDNVANNILAGPPA